MIEIVSDNGRLPKGATLGIIVAHIDHSFTRCVIAYNLLGMA